MPSLLELGELAHPLEVRGPLHVEVLLRGATEHEREHDLHEEIGLEVGLGRDGLGQPRLDLALPGLGDGVALAVGTGSGLGLAGHGLSVPRQTGEGGVHLAEGKGPAPAEVGVVVALQVVAVARFAVEEAEEGHGNAHIRENTLSVYVRSIPVVDTRARPVQRPGAPAVHSSLRCLVEGEDGCDQGSRTAL